jgi:nitrogen-specific signal transduction histidine kinase
MDDETTREIIHEINNALTTIMGAAELIRAESAPESQTARDAADIVEAALRSRELVAQLRSGLDA